MDDAPEPGIPADPAAALAAACRAALHALGRGGRLIAIGPGGRPHGPGSDQLFHEAKILFVRSNAWEIAWGQRRERLVAGEVLLVAPGTIHRERVPAGQRTQVLNLFTAGEDLVVTVAEVTAPFTVQMRGESRFLAARGELLRHLVVLLAGDSGLATARRQAEQLMLHLLLAASSRPQRSQRGGDFLAIACRRLIEDRHTDPACNVARLAAALDVHPGSLARAFRRATGNTVAAALAARRMQSAQRLLVQARLPIAEVARRSGFTRRDVFTRAFRAATDRSPVQWRRLGFLEDDVLRR